MPPHRPVVLVCDDDAFSRKLIADLLVGAGFDVVVVQDPDQALHELKDRPFDLLLTDYQLGARITGIELLERASRT